MHSTGLSSSLPLLALASLLGSAAAAVVPLVETSDVATGVTNVPTPPKLAPLPHLDARGSLSKRDRQAAFALRDYEHFYWGHNAANPVANLTGYFPGEHEHIVSMDRFVGMLDAVDCRDPDLMLDFKDAESFAYAQDSWTWVNHDHANRFLMVANYPGCGPANARQPFEVTAIDYDTDKYIAYLTARKVDWEDALPQWEVHANTDGLVPHAGSSKRSLLHPEFNDTFRPDVSTDFSRDLFSTSVSGIDVALKCDPCGTSGALNIAVHAKGSLFPPSVDEASIDITPSSVSAFVTLALEASGTLISGFETTIPVVSAPLPGGFDVPLVKIGPNINVNVGASMSDWEGQARVSYGATLAIPDDSRVLLDFVDSDRNAFSGWAPSFTPNGPALDASVTASAEIFAGASIDLSATIGGKGFQGGLAMKLPDLTADLTAAVSLGDGSEGVCDTHQPAGVDVDVHLGMNIAATAGLADADPFFSKDLFTTGVDLFSTCIGFGDPLTTPADPSPTADPTPTSGGPVGPTVTAAPNGTVVDVRRRAIERRFAA